MSNSIVWGIIGCGDVAEVKSGPAFQKCVDSELFAVMRRNGKLAKDFADRHKVSLWFDTVEGLLENPKINAVYVATPPSTHLDYAIKAMEAGKDVYLEKPMVLSKDEANILSDKIETSGQKLVVAHYRRFLPKYVKIKELLDNNQIGTVKYVDLKYLQPFNFNAKAKWRLNASVSGGGYFHDIAPHQIDLMYHFFGSYKAVKGIGVNQSKRYDVADMVNGLISFKNDIQFRGVWSFDIPQHLEEDRCIIYGTEGAIEFSFYNEQLKVYSNKDVQTYNFINPENIQQLLIQETVNYFLGKRNNPCSVEEGSEVISIMEAFTKE
jgi:predicted dehydrogenase